MPKQTSVAQLKKRLAQLQRKCDKLEYENRMLERVKLWQLEELEPLRELRDALRKALKEPNP